MRPGPPGSFGAQLKALREAAGYTQEELATIAGISVHGVSALERGERRRPHLETVRALSAALDLTGAVRDTFVGSVRAPADTTAVDELRRVSLPLALTALLGRDADVQTLGQWLADPAVRLIALTGPGGVGKTRLALEVAHAIAAEGASRVVFVPLAEIRTPAFVASAIAEALGLSNVTALDLPWWSDAVTRFEALAMPWGTGYSLLGLASVALASGDTDQAERLLDEADEALRHAGPWLLTRTLTMRAVIALVRGHTGEAFATVHDCLTHIRVLQDKFTYLYALVALAIAADLTSADVWAARIFGARDALIARTGHAVALKFVHDLGTEAERRVRARLDPEQWAQAYAAGRETSIDALLRDVDSVARSAHRPIRGGQSGGPMKS